MSVSPEPLHGFTPDQSVLDTPAKLRLARGILEKTCETTGAGFLLFMFVPGTDLVMRSFRGLDSPEECVAMAKEVSAILRQHLISLETDKQNKANGQPEAHN